MSSFTTTATTTPLLARTHPARVRWGASAAGAGGSYTPVFIVLGVIAALLVISCLVGQVCTKKHLRPRPRRDRVAYYDDDIEGGLGGHWPHGGPAIAKMEAAAPSATSVEARPAVDGAVAAYQTAP